MERGHSPQAKRFASFAEFFPFYLGQHANPACRRLHFAGSTVTLLCAVAFVATLNPLWIVAAAVSGYGLAWIGHCCFEYNQPATVRQPRYSFMGDWWMYWQMVTRRLPF